MPVLVFDVNETLLDLSVLEPGFDELFGDGAGAMREWFATLLHASVVANQLDRYQPFGRLGARALATVAERRSLSLSEQQVGEALSPFRTLPAHADVLEGLTLLESAGIRMAALTNTAYDGLSDLLASAGIARFMQGMLSVDEVRRFKPAAEVYLMAAAKLGIEPTEMIMVASHDWDLMGARAVGARTAFIARPGSVWSFPDNVPDYEGGDLIEVASQIIADLA